MPGAVRSNKKAMKIAYEVMKTEESLQQSNKKPPKKLLKAWEIGTVKAQ